MQFLLITDLDNTLVGDRCATIAINQKLLPLRRSLYLIYATGRSVASARQLIANEPLLEPDYLVTGVGTEIYHNHIQDNAWAERLAHNWQRDSIDTLAKSLPQLIPQPSSEQNPWKLSYYINSPDRKAVIANLRQKISIEGLAAQVIFSSDRDLDIVPSNSGKGEAVSYLRQKLQIAPQATLVCGDSGNDISMFQQQTLGVIVSNSQPELIDWHKSNQCLDRYLAKSSYAWGILEALAHFKLFIGMEQD